METETNNDLSLQDEERRRPGVPAIARKILPRNLWENPANWKRTKVALAAILMLATVGPATAFTVGKKATPPEAVQQVASKPSDDANLPPYFRVVDSGQRCGDPRFGREEDRKVEVENPDTVPGQPALSALLATNPCYNYAWTEKDGTVVINFVTYITIDSYQMERTAQNPAFRMYVTLADKQTQEILNALALDLTQKLSGGLHLAKWIEQNSAPSKDVKLDWYEENAKFFMTLRQLANHERVRIRLTDATREREAADKLPGDFLLPGGTADRYKLILARMSPSDWEKFQMTDAFGGQAIDDGNIEEGVKIIKRALSYLKDPREIHAAVERKQRGPAIYSEPGKRALAELGLS